MNAPLASRCRPTLCLSILLAALSALLVPGTQAQAALTLPPSAVKSILAPPLVPPAVGNAQADVTLVEYFDFNCPVCRHSEPDVEHLLATDPHIRLIRRNWPIFGAVSAYAAYCSFAAAQMGQGDVAQHALMNTPLRLDSNAAVDTVLHEGGLDIDQIHFLIEQHRGDYSAVLTRSQREADALGIQGTPAWVIGDQLLPGELAFTQLKNLVARVRSRRHQQP